MKDDKQDNQSGQSIVELAVTLPLLLLMFLGTVELGQVCYGAINVSNAAKAAAQYGAQDTNTAVQTGNMLTAAQREIGTVVPGQTGPLDMTAATTMPDGSELPTGTVCKTSGGC
jgi:Flp pilus assembly protein TadG